jgi:hypothetical protein
VLCIAAVGVYYGCGEVVVGGRRRGTIIGLGNSDILSRILYYYYYYYYYCIFCAVSVIGLLAVDAAHKNKELN